MLDNRHINVDGCCEHSQPCFEQSSMHTLLQGLLTASQSQGKSAPSKPMLLIDSQATSASDLPEEQEVIAPAFSDHAMRKPGWLTRGTSSRSTPSAPIVQSGRRQCIAWKDLPEICLKCWQYLATPRRPSSPRMAKGMRAAGYGEQLRAIGASGQSESVERNRILLDGFLE